jgi:spermidine synthase
MNTTIPWKTRLIVAAIFFVSGAAGLVYEVLWSRQLGLIFGISTYAVATVLATYMGGLAIGSFIVGRLVDRWKNPLAAYALLEVAIGLYALLVPTLFAGLREPYIFLHHVADSRAFLIAGRTLMAASILLIPTVLMGGTFPVLTRFWVRLPRNVGLGTGLLYFTNTAGAIVGCLAAGFFLIENYGLRGTTWIAALINFSVAGIAYLLSRGTGQDSSHVHHAADGEGVSAIPAPIARLVLICIAVSGFTSLGYEVLWSRALVRYLYNSTYAFTTMLATFLAGIAIGSAIYTVLLRNTRHPVRLFAILQTLIAVGFYVASFLFADLMETSASIVGSDTVQSFAQAVTVMFVRAGLILLVPAIFLGATLPLATAICARGLASLGQTVGRVYAVNTFGSILGSLGAGFVLIPTIGMHGTLRLLIATNLVAAIALAAAATSSNRARILATASGVVAAIALTVAIPSDLFERTLAYPGETFAYYHEGATDTVAVVDTSIGQRYIMYDDRRGTAGTNSYDVNFFLGHLPMLLHSGTPSEVLHVCFGVGNSLSAVVVYDELDRVDNVELSPHVVDAAPYFWTNNDVINHPKVNTIIDDGRNYLMSTDNIYDVIMLEPPETFTAGVINLYTREFYEDALAHLAPDGLMMQWVPAGEAPLDEERSLFRSFSDVFPHVSAWQQLSSGSVLLIGTREEFTIDYQRLRSRFEQESVLRDMTLSGVRNVDHLLSYLIFDDAGFRAFGADVAPVTDDQTVLDFTMPRYLGSGFGLGSFAQDVTYDGADPIGMAMRRNYYYKQHRRSVMPYLTNLGDFVPDEIAARIEDEHLRPTGTAPIPREQWKR